MLLELENISFGFSKEKQILNGLTFEIEEGNIYALMGPNGSGKSTLFNLITGYYKPQKGTIKYKRKDITKLPPYTINRIGIGRTFQDLRLISQLTVKENVLLALRGNPTDNWLKALLPQYFYTTQMKQLEEKAETILDEYFLSNVINSSAGEISYGQQKLLNLACCVANNAELLLLDEPLAGINPIYRNHIGELLNKLKVCGLTILIIDHNTEIIERLADTIFFLSGGKMETYSSYQNFKTDPLVLEGYL